MCVCVCLCGHTYLGLQESLKACVCHPLTGCFEHVWINNRTIKRIVFQRRRIGKEFIHLFWMKIKELLHFYFNVFLCFSTHFLDHSSRFSIARLFIAFQSVHCTCAYVCVCVCVCVHVCVYMKKNTWRQIFFPFFLRFSTIGCQVFFHSSLARLVNRTRSILNLLVWLLFIQANAWKQMTIADSSFID